MALRRAARWALPLLLGVITWLALSPAPPERLSTGWDKLNHLAAFAALGLAACLGFARTSAVRWGGLPHGWIAGLLAYGGLIELLQARIPNRSGDWSDLAADALGLLLAIAAFAAGRPRRPLSAARPGPGTPSDASPRG